MRLEPIDQAIWNDELENFVPRKMFDFHTHLWDDRFRGELSGPPTGLRKNADVARVREFSAAVFPGRSVEFMFLPTPLKGIDVNAHNQWMFEQSNLAPKSIFGMLATPTMDPEDVANAIEKNNVAAFKPYRFYGTDPDDGGIRSFLPERLIEVADHYDLVILLHMSKKAGPADPENLSDLKEFTKRYPRIKWVLAHCARAFNHYFLEKSIHVLKDLPNIWYETSAVNDPLSHIILLKHEDRKRIMFGSDNISAGGMKGKYITYARAWEGYKGNPELTHCDPSPTFVIYEQLRQQRQAADLLELTRDEIEDLFHRNAERLIETIRT